MADTKTTDLAELTLPAPADELMIVDKSDTTMGASGTNKRVRVDSVPLPAGHINGLTLSNNVTDATNDIDIAAGKCRSSDDGANLILASALTKRLDAAWAVGTNQGGLDTGTIANGTYHVWLIRRSDTGVVDALFSTSATAPTMPTNYDYKRRIGAIVRVSAAIKAFNQHGDYFAWATGVRDVNTTVGTTAALFTLSVPAGIKVSAFAMVYITKAGVGVNFVTTDPDQTDVDPATGTITQAATSSVVSAFRGYWMTNVSSQIRCRSSQATTSLIVDTWGWIDTRGRND